MLKIFVPQKIFDDFSFNFLTKDEENELKKSFENIEIIDFKINFFSWKILKNPYYEEDLIIFANWKFWEKYLYDSDFTKKQIFSFWKYFYQKENYFEEIKNIESKIFEIKNILESKNLLTNSKKNIIREEIITIFFTLTSLYFSIFELLEKTKSNILELENIDSKIEFEAVSSLIVETSKTKKIELEKNLLNLENHIYNFYEVIKKYFLN